MNPTYSYAGVSRRGRGGRARRGGPGRKRKIPEYNETVEYSSSFQNGLPEPVEGANNGINRVELSNYAIPDTCNAGANSEPNDLKSAAQEFLAAKVSANTVSEKLCQQKQLSVVL